jgi:hypothetical protein
MKHLPCLDKQILSPSSSSLKAPTQIVLDDMDSVYVAAAGNNRVLFFERDLAGVLSTTASRVYGQSSSFTTAHLCGPAGFASVSAIAIDPRDGSLWFLIRVVWSIQKATIRQGRAFRSACAGQTWSSLLLLPKTGVECLLTVVLESITFVLDQALRL